MNDTFKITNSESAHNCLNKFKKYGNDKGLILLIDEEKLDLNIIGQVRKYLEIKEKMLKTNK